MSKSFDQAIHLHAEPRAALGELMHRYHVDAQARRAVNAWLAKQLEAEIERRSRA